MKRWIDKFNKETVINFRKGQKKGNGLMYTFRQIHTQAHLYVCMYVCTYVLIHAYNQNKIRLLAGYIPDVSVKIMKE